MADTVEVETSRIDIVDGCGILRETSYETRTVENVEIIEVVLIKLDTINVVIIELNLRWAEWECLFSFKWKDPVPC